MARSSISGQLRYAAQLLKADCDPRLRSDLFSAVGSLTWVSGFTSFDVFDHSEAANRFRFSLVCATEADDWHLRALVYASMARQAFWLSDPQQALTHVEMALVRADRLTATERSMLSSLRARALACMGQRQDALRAVGTADEEFSRSDTAKDPPTIAYYDLAEHNGETGHALADLGALRGCAAEGERRLRAAARAHTDLYARSRVFCELRLSRLLLETGETDEVLEIARPALDAVPAIASRRIGLVVDELGQAINHHRGISAIGVLRDQVRALRR